MTPGMRGRLPKVGGADIDMTTQITGENPKIWGDFYGNGNQDNSFSEAADTYFNYSGARLRWHDNEGANQYATHSLFGNIYGNNKGFHIDGWDIDDSVLPTSKDRTNIDITPGFNSHDGDLVFVYYDNDSGNNVLRRASLTGDIIWTGTDNTSPDACIYVDSNENIIIGARGGGIERYDYDTGDRIWRTVPGRVRSACSDGSTAYCLPADQVDESTFASKVAMSDGTVRESVTLDSSSDTATRGCVVTTSGNYLLGVVGTDVYKIDISSFSVSNTFNGLAVGDLLSSPFDCVITNDAGGNDNFYVITDNGVAKYDGANNQVWETATNGVRGNLRYYQNNGIRSDKIIQTTPGEKLYVLDASTGNIDSTTTNFDFPVCSSGGRLL